MFFKSTLVSVRNHRAYQQLVVLRVHDSLQTYVGLACEFTELLQPGAAVIVLRHQCQLRQLPDAFINTILACHFCFLAQPPPSTFSVIVQKFGQLISFGVVLLPDAFQQLCSAGQLISTDGSLFNNRWLSEAPPVVRCLATQPCVIVEWNARQTTVATVTLAQDGTIFLQFLSRPFSQDRAWNWQKEAVRLFVTNNSDRLANLFEEIVAGTTADAAVINIDLVPLAANQGIRVICSAIELVRVAKRTILSKRKALHIFQEHNIASDAVLKKCNSSALEWCGYRDASFIPAEIASPAVANLEPYYNEYNSLLLEKLMQSNPESTMLQHGAALAVIKTIQSHCDRHCCLRRGECDGLQIQFDTMPYTVFLIPSLNSLLVHKR